MAVVVPLTDAVAAAVRKRNLWYERLPFTGGPAGGPFALGVGPNPIFGLSQINASPTLPEWRMHLQGLAATQVATAYLTVNYDKARLAGTATSGALAAIRAGVRPDPYVDVAALGTMNASVQSTAVVATFQMNYLAAFKRLTTAEKLLLSQSGQKQIKLGRDEQAALDYGNKPGQGKPLNIAKGVTSGKLLVPWAVEMEHRYQAYVTKVDTLWLYGADLPNADTPLGDTVYAADDEILVVRSIAVENDPVTAALPAAVLAATVDSDVNYLGWSCQAFADADDHGFDCFLPAKTKVDFSGQSAAGANLPARVTIWHVSLTEALKIRQGSLTKDEAGDRFFYQVVGGVA